MLEELTHRGDEIPEKEKDKDGKEITVGYKKTLYDIMKKTESKKFLFFFYFFLLIKRPATQ